MIKIGLLGFGTVGSGVAKVLQENFDTIQHKSGQAIYIKRILERDPQKCVQAGIPAETVTQDINDIIHDPDIDIVIELIGGIEPARTFIIEAMKNGKHVVTANKDLIALKGKELLHTAEEQQVDFYFEASVGGGIPVIMPLKQSLAANNIEAVIGILNGTTNYILTKMTVENRDYADVLAEAQALGYAEANPSSDVEGLDAARKIAILASISFNSRVTVNDVFVEGITKISPLDIRYARDMGYIIKLLAIAKEEHGSVQVSVYPALLPSNHPLSSVNDSFNAVFIHGDAVGDIMLYGRGAGQLPTASAVIGDVIEIVRNIEHNSTARIGCTCFAEKPLMPHREIKNKFYVRLNVVDKPGVLAVISSSFGENNVSIASVWQKSQDKNRAELVLITHKVKELDLEKALNSLADSDCVHNIDNVIRVEGD